MTSTVSWKDTAPDTEMSEPPPVPALTEEQMELVKAKRKESHRKRCETLKRKRKEKEGRVDNILQITQELKEDVDRVSKDINYHTLLLDRHTKFLEEIYKRIRVLDEQQNLNELN